MRAIQRFGVGLSRENFEALVRQIQRGDAHFVEKQSHRISVYRVTLPDGQRARAVYDRQRKTIVTFLPKPLPPSSDVHVLPINDFREHQEMRGCWCRPTTEEASPGAAVVVHHSLDGREYREPDGPVDHETVQ